ncbi:protein O-mannose kinase-like [Montipora capricornis]|uniref:protein O-mannose kinase-like n=1 Tax=Montipora capricornis TaxID=246305 RepID=UPI0035F1081A
MYYKYGSLRFLDRLFQHKELSKYNNIQTRMQLIVAYAKVLRYLHNSPIGVRVMCDSPFLDKLLDQYLITDDFQLVVNDVDGLEEVTEQGGCHRKPNVSLSLQLETERQGWPRLSEPLPFQLRPVFDEKIDIWKIPWVADKIFGKVKGSDFVKSQLREIMNKCNAINPRQRPTANDVLHELLQVQKLIVKRRRVS